MPDITSTNVSDASPLGVVVRSADGTFKIWKDGQWQIIESRQAEQRQTNHQTTVPNVLQSMKPTFAGPMAAAYFSAAEEQEARKLAQRLDTTAVHKRYSLSKIVTQLQAKMTQPISASAEQVLWQAVLTFLRGSRSAVDLSLLLIKPQDQGGLGLSADNAQLMVGILSAINGKIKVEAGEVIDDRKAAKEALVMPVNVRPAPVIKSLVPVEIQEPIKKQEFLPPPPPPLPVKQAMPQRPLRQSLNDTRPKLADVQNPAATARRRLVGPVDELRNLDLATFRSLGATPAEQVAKIVEKIKGLGKESISRWVEGSAAWRESDVYRIYREIGIESIQTARPVAEIAGKRFSTGIPTLTEAEFNAIADGNQQIRY